jgi:hypothetical protein
MPDIIYLSDPRKASPDSMKTVLRHPVAKISEEVFICRY